MPVDRPAVRALLADCKENPNDDTPRLILADWLEEREDPRGSFLRAQVQAARLPERDPERRHLESQAEAILQRHESQWLGTLRPHLLNWEFSRGLIRAGAIGHDLLSPPVENAVGGEALAWIESLRLFEAGPHLPALSRTGILSGVRALNLMYNRLGDGMVRSWLEAAPLPGLQELDLFNNQLGVGAVEAFRAGPPLPALQRLNLGSNPLGGHGFQELLRAATLPRLEVLQLERIRLRHLGTVSNETLWQHLHTLDLPDNDLAVDALRVLVRGTPLPPLRRLTLRAASIGDAACQALAEAGPRVAHLEWLALPGCGLTDTGVAILANCPYLANVRTLLLDGNQLTATSMQALLHSPHLTGLRELSLQDMLTSTPPTVPMLLGAPRMAQLTSLGCLALRHDPIAAARLLRRYPSLSLE